MGDRNEMEEAWLRQGCFAESFTDKISLWHYCPGLSSSVWIIHSACCGEGSENVVRRGGLGLGVAMIKTNQMRVQPLGHLAAAKRVSETRVRNSQNVPDWSKHLTHNRSRQSSVQTQIHKPITIPNWQEGVPNEDKATGNLPKDTSETACEMVRNRWPVEASQGEKCTFVRSEIQKSDAHCLTGGCI